jgi:protease I
MSRKVLMIIAPEQFRDEELLVPRSILQAAGCQVTTVSTRTGVATGMFGESETITQTVADVLPNDYNAVAVVGGMGTREHLWENPQVLSLLQAFNAQRKVVGGICLSGAVVAQSGILKGKRGTCWETPETLATLAAHGVTYTEAPCTVEGHIITANGPEAAEAFGKAILASIPTSQPA